jgi:hypothetical protein
MKNYINKNINTEIRWSREITRKKRNGKKPLGKIDGLYILDKNQKSLAYPTGYCGSIQLNSNGSLEFWTNGNYQFIKAEIAKKLICELLKRIS